MGSNRAAWSLALGLLATLVLPVAIFATRYSNAVELLHVGFLIPVALGAGIGAIVLAGRARALDGVRRGDTESGRAAASGRVLGIIGICIASSATISLAVYGVLLIAD